MASAATGFTRTWPPIRPIQGGARSPIPLLMSSTVTRVTGPEVRAMAWSYVRVFTAVAIGVFLTLGRLPLDLTRSDLKAITNAVLAAMILTVYNFVRAGDHRFGNGTDDVVHIAPQALRSTQAAAGVPVATNNAPRLGDGEQLPFDEAFGDVEWSGSEMR